MSIYSTDYKYFQYDEQESVNHPSIDKDLVSSFSSIESNPPPSQIKSEIHCRSIFDSGSEKVKSFRSEPIHKTLFTVSTIPLTEEELARHNRVIPPLTAFPYSEQQVLNKQEETIEKERNEDYKEHEDELNESLLLKRVDERCNTMKQEMDEKLRLLEEQLTKAEQDYNQTRCDIEELNSMEKVYIDQGIQTELNKTDLKNMENIKHTVKGLSLDPHHFKDQVSTWKMKADQLDVVDEFATQTKKIVWDTPFIPLTSICRQLPTAVHLDDIEDDKDVCDYHRQRYEKAKLKSEQEKKMYQSDHHATLNRLSKLVQYQ